MKILVLLLCFQLTLSAKPKHNLQDYWLDSTPKEKQRVDLGTNQKPQQATEVTTAPPIGSNETAPDMVTPEGLMLLEPSVY